MGIKYYHSGVTQIRKMYCLTDANGTIIYQPETKPEFVKNSPRVTICSILDGDKLSFGYSTCASKDVYRKKIGNKIAYERAIKRPYFSIELSDKKDIHAISDKIIDEIYDIETKRIFHLK